MRSLLRRRSWIVPLGLASTLTVGSCAKNPEPPVEPGAGAAAAAPAPPVELAPVEHPSELLPRDTPMLVVGKSFERAAEVFERERLIKAFPEPYESLRELVVRSTGHDLLDPAAWPAAGLDPAAPLGFAVIDPVEAQLAVFATLADRARALEFIRGAAGRAERTLVEQSYGAALVLRPAEERGGPSFIVRDRLVVMVVGDGDGGRALAERLVLTDPNVSLASAKGYRKATGGLRGADLTTFVDAAGLVERINVESESRASKPETNWAQEELVKAQKEGADAERLAELEQQAQDERERQERWRRTEAAERALAARLVADVEGIGLTATTKRSGPIFDGRIVAGEASLWRRLLANREGAPQLTRAMNGEPLFCLSGELAGEPALELFQAVVEADGESWSDFLAEVQAELGLELLADVGASLAGDAELCLTVEGALDPTRGDPTQSLGLGVLVGFSDPTRPAQLLAKAAGSSSELGRRMRKQGEGYALAMPDWRTLYVEPRGDRIVVTTDPELGARLAAGQPGNMPSKIRPSGARGAMDLPATALSEAVDLSLASLGVLTGRLSLSETVVMAPEGMTQQEMDDVPHSRASTKARKELERRAAKLERFEAKRRAADIARVRAITDPLGMFVVAAIEDERGFTITGGQFLRVGSLGQVLEVVLRAALEPSPPMEPADQEALEAAWRQHNDAAQAYREARLEDAERARARSSRRRGR